MKSPRAAVPCATSSAKIRIAQAELQLLGLAVMNAWQVGTTSFSLQALRDGLRDREDEFPPPHFKKFWCLRDEARRAAAVFLEAENAFEVVAHEMNLVVHLCPSDLRWAVLVRAGVVVHWPQTSAQGVRRKSRG